MQIEEESLGEPVPPHRNQYATNEPIVAEALVDPRVDEAPWKEEAVTALLGPRFTELISEALAAGVEIVRFDSVEEIYREPNGDRSVVKLSGDEAVRAGEFSATQDPTQPLRIYVPAAASNLVAAEILFHELTHWSSLKDRVTAWRSGPPGTTLEFDKAEEEVKARALTEEYFMRRGLPPTFAGRRTDGRVDELRIGFTVRLGTHYVPGKKGPDGVALERQFLQRRYSGYSPTTWGVK